MFTYIYLHAIGMEIQDNQVENVEFILEYRQHVGNYNSSSTLLVEYLFNKGLFRFCGNSMHC